MFKQILKPFNKSLMLSCVLPVLVACQGSHLEIMPDLSDETLLTEHLSVEQMHQDIDALLKGALERHPDLDKYTQVSELKSYTETLKAQVTQPLMRTEFYRIVGKLSHKFNDGHAFLIWPYQEYNLLKEQGAKPFPFEVFTNTQQELYIQNDYHSGSDRVVGQSKILSINGISTKDLVLDMQKYTGGESQLLREKVVAARFPVNLWAVYGFINEFKLEIEVEGKVKTLQITQAQDWQQTESVITEKTKKEHYFKELDDGVALLYLDHFDIKPSKFEDFVDESFEQIKALNIHSLIIDIRNNPGGNTDTVAYLSRYLANKPFRLVSALQEKLNKENRGWFNYKGEEGEVVDTKWDDWETPMSDDIRYSGKVYLLTGAMSYSAAIVFATTLKDNGFATLVGQPTQGFANQSGQGNLFNLPHSELRAYITTRLLVRPSGELTQQGVQPHYEIEPGNSITQNMDDKTIAATLELIRK
ncbi:MAG: peptidase S41 [Pseudoalteromonas sp.]|nr:peptidase S41 [Pseudoalteromonas sp.]